ncbi:MAG: aspartate/glutamate racemase family protein [Rickettsiales bacterium]|nr:aspartate/glutamate racemase family protein [Rickettsiales bacterium]
MKVIGLLGGMSWESTAIYYRLLNEMVREQLGGLHSAKLMLWSFDFDEIVSLQTSGNWQEATHKMIEAGHALKAGGADMLVICTNTMHKMADDIEQAVQLPLLHIVDATAHAIKTAGLRKVGLLATKFTMEERFYTERLHKQQIETLIPDEQARTDIHRIIFQELCKGIINPASKMRYLDIIASLKQQGAEGVILGCTEIGLLIQQADTTLPVFDTTYLHARAAVNFATSQ